MDLNLNDRKKYYLIYEDDKFLIEEIIEWNSDDLTLKRSKEYYGIFAEYSNTITFINYTAEFLKDVFNKDGVNAKVMFVIEKQNNENKFIRYYSSYIDFFEYKFSDNKVSLKMKDLGIAKAISINQNKKIEIDRITRLDDTAIEELETNILFMHGRNINLQSKSVRDWEAEPNPNIIPLNNHIAKAAALTKKTTNNDVSFHSQLERNNIPTTDNMFYINDTGQTVELDINFRIRQDMQILPYNDHQPFYGGNLKVEWLLVKYDNGVNFDNETILHIIKDDTSTLGHDIFINTNKNYLVQLQDGESLMLMHKYTITPLDGNITNADDIRLSIRSHPFRVETTVVNNSSFPSSNSESIMIYNLLDRVFNIIGVKSFKSNYLGKIEDGYDKDGELSMIAFLHGYWIRKFDKNDILFKPITISLKDLLTSIDTIGCIGVGIKNNGLQQSIIVESRDFFFQDFVGIQIEDCKILSEEPYKDDYYNKLEIGYKKPSGDNLYEEAYGLEEPNAKTEYSNVIEKDKTLKILSPSRADTYGTEFARRKQKSTHPTDDTRYDKSNFMVSVLRGDDDDNFDFKLKRWQDSMMEEPKNIFSPDTAFNLELSPANLVLKHEKYLKSCLYNYLDTKLKYINSVGNSSMITNSGRGEISESGDIKLDLLKNKKFIAYKVEIQTNINDELYNSIISNNSDGVPNMYGMVEYKDNNGKLNYGYILEVLKNDNKIILIKR